MEKINLADKFALFTDHWQPRIVGDMNDYHIKVVRLKGEFIWHKHDDTDELFLVVGGAMTIRLRDRDVPLAPGEIFVVPRGVEHLPVAMEEAQVLLLEPRGTLNTGDAGGERTVTEEMRI